ncbi:hypothetical protein [Salinimonas chungwhensis]|uniref:hypothetical protein n=1 Tax=Salinimonas chungwhensis TaxID=265425 RepID=UPI00037D0A96|nr:hypothetical protein [Salinimonas chungwhensis]
MKYVTKAAVITALLANSFYSLAEETPLKVLSYHVDPVSILDENATFLRTVAADTLPTPTVEVLDTKPSLDLVKIVDKQGNEVWLDTYELKLNKGKVVNLDCHKLVEAAPDDRKEAGTMGYGGRCNQEGE